MEIIVESPAAKDRANKDALRAHSKNFLEEVRHLLDGQQLGHDMTATLSAT